MKRHHAFLILATVLVASVLALILIPRGHHHAKGDADHASDCWAHAVNGHRHCATR